MRVRPVCTAVATAVLTIAALVPATPARAAASGTVWVGQLGFNDQGRVVALRSASRTVNLPSPGGLFLRDPVTGSQFPVEGTIRASADEVEQDATVAQLSARVHVAYHTVRDGSVQVRGAITDPTGADRVLDSVFSLPMPVTSGVWGRDTAKVEPFNEFGAAGTQISMPVASVANETASFGVSYSIPPAAPSRFEMSLTPPTEMKPAVSWEFNQDSDTEGWQPIGQPVQMTPPVVADGVLSTTSTGTRPIMQQMQPFSAPGSAGAVVEITMQSSVSSTGFLNWTTANEPQFTASRRATFSVTAGGMHTYDVELPPEDSDIVGLRVAPIGTEGDIKIDSIRLLSNVLLGPPAFSLRQMWGFSPAASGALKSRAPFTFDVDLGVSPQWGFRSALQRYYDRSPQWFANPAGQPACPGGEAYGAWQFIPTSYYENPTAYGYQMAGRGKWDPATGADATTLPQYGSNDEWSAAQAKCTRIYPYTIPGQREITDLDSLPQTRQDAMQDLRHWQHDPITFSANNETNTFSSAQQQQQLIANSAVLDANGDPALRVRNTQWCGNSVTFPTDANPRLYANDPSKLTLGRLLLDRYVPQMLSDPRVSGIFSDTLFEWGRYFDYAHDHFPAARIPLTYTADTQFPTSPGSPATSSYGTAYKAGLYNDFSNLEYLWALRDLLHHQGKTLMTNGLRALNGETRVFDGFASDVMGVEMTMNFMNGDDSNDAFYQDVAYHKPVLPMMYNNQLDGQGRPVTDWSNRDMVEQTWKDGLLYGMTPASSNTTSVDAVVAPGLLDASQTGTQGLEVEYQKKYMPVARTLLSAGWQPVTGIHTNQAANQQGVRVERYGSADDFYLVIYNRADTAVDTTFSVDHSMLPGIDGSITDLATGQAPAAGLVAGLQGQGDVSLAGQEFHVLHFTF